MARTIDLTGKVALVTGGGRGIGKAIAARLADAGAGVVIASRKKENLDAAAAELSGLAGKIVPIVCHLGKADQIEALVKETESRLGPIDILVNNSATNVGQGPALEVTDDMLDKMVEINIKAALRLIRLTVPKMIERGKGGSIINVSSISGLKPQTGGLLYSFTKAGLIMMTRSWAREFGAHGIRVNAIAPGFFASEMTDSYRPGYLDSMKPRIVAGRMGEGPEVAAVAVFLASEAASYITGQTLAVDGGVTIT